jgi:AraC-like DNA-binding protein
MIESTILQEIGKDPMYKTWHTSPTHLLLYVHAGQGSIVCAERVYPMEPGLLVYIAADTYHYTMPDDPAAYVRSKVFLHPSALEKLQSLGLNDAAKALVCAPIPPNERSRVEALFSRAAEHRQGLLSAATVLELLHYLHAYAAGSTDAPTGFVSRAIGYINQNIAWDMTLEDICRNVNVSKFHLCRSFREHTGMTVMEYILNTRIILAKNELLKTDDSVATISSKCGFSSASYFCRAFHQKEGCTPLQFRKQGK